MTTLIRNLLTYSRIATQPQALRSVALDGVVGEVLTDLDLVIEETGAQVTVEPLPTVVGDPTQLGQLFGNLLSNALKFRQPNIPPMIRVDAQRVVAEALPTSLGLTRAVTAYYLIEVSDNDIGFEQHSVERIFGVFQRLHGRNQGIGLAICAKVTANHGGAITAPSQPGQGTTFQIYLPVSDRSEQ